MLDFFIEKHGKRVFGLCMSLCCSKASAEELYQETWLRALKKIEKYDTEKDFEPWITKICVNIYRDKLRRQRKSPFYDGFKTAQEKQAAINAVADEKTSYSFVYDAINTLPEKLRVTVILHYFEDKDIRTVAKTLNIPEGTVKSRLNTARKLLKEELKDEFQL